MNPPERRNIPNSEVTRALAFILSGKQRTIYLGNLDAQRDWGYAPEYVQLMWQMLQHD
jgi:GDPmannose 4,6-dehydratase